jgi:CarD family transcriptional regulator
MSWERLGFAAMPHADGGQATVRVGTTDMVRNTSPGKSVATKAGAKKHPLAKPSNRPATPIRAGARKVEPARAEAKHMVKAAKPVVKKVVSKKVVPVQPPAKVAAKPVAAGKVTPVPANGAVKPPMSKASPATPAPARAMAAALNREAGGAISVTPKAPGDKPAAPRQQAPTGPRKPVNQRHGFKTNEWIVYPSHGVGRIVGIEEQEIAGMSLELFVITFEKDKMTLRVPTGKSSSVGMRKLAEESIVKRAMETLKGRARIKRTMWSRRAQEYEAKINSGDLIAIAEVVRDLYRSESQPEQSYSERQLYEAALDRMAREIAAVDKLDDRGATQRITEVLAKSAKGRRAASEEAEIKAA